MDFTGGEVTFWNSVVTSGGIGFGDCTFSGGKIDFRSIKKFDEQPTAFSGNVTFRRSKFTGAEVLFNRAVFEAARVEFYGAEFAGGKVDFDDVQIRDGELDFSNVADWSAPPVNLPNSAPGLKLPPARA